MVLENCLGTLTKYNLIKGSLSAGHGVFMHDIGRWVCVYVCAYVGGLAGGCFAFRWLMLDGEIDSLIDRSTDQTDG
jgi:hypothetical protein